jgi:transposase
MPKLLFARRSADAAEEDTIRKLARARHAPADWIQRAQIITFELERCEGSGDRRGAGCSEKTVRYRLSRFDAEGIKGFADRPGVGRKRRITEQERSRIIALTRTDPPGRLVQTGEGLAAADQTGPPCWTLDSLTEAARGEGIDIHRSQLRIILLAEGVRWRRTHSWSRSTDPEFVPKGRGSWSSTPTRRTTPRSSAPTSWVR